MLKLQFLDPFYFRQSRLSLLTSSALPPLSLATMAAQRTLGRVLASTSAAVRPAAARPLAVAGARCLSTSSIRFSAAAAPSGKESPFVEPAGRNPAEDYKPFTPALQEYGAWL